MIEKRYKGDTDFLCPQSPFRGARNARKREIGEIWRDTERNGFMMNETANETANGKPAEKVETRETDNGLDIGHILAVLWHRAWLIVLAGILAAAIVFGWSTYTTPELYSSTATVYVNDPTNYGFSIGNISTARSLVKTYLVLLRNRTSLEMVLDAADRKDVYTYGQLSGMISAAAIDETEVIAITVTAGDPVEAARLANAIVEVLPVRIEEIMDGASMRLIDSAIPNYTRIGSTVTRDTFLGLLVGMVLMSALLIVLDMLNDVIRDESYILQTYDVPILARVPDLAGDNAGRYGYRKYGYGKTPHRGEGD